MKEIKVSPKIPSAFGYYSNQNMRDRVYQIAERKDVAEPASPDPKQDIFDRIFSVDPRTKLPSGDIALFMTQNTSPEVRDFIQQNLMRPVNADTDAGKYDGLDDDIIALYTRGADEDIYDYRDRMYHEVYNHYRQRKSAEKVYAQSE